MNDLSIIVSKVHTLKSNFNKRRTEKKSMAVILFFSFASFFSYRNFYTLSSILPAKSWNSASLQNRGCAMRDNSGRLLIILSVCFDWVKFFRGHYRIVCLTILKWFLPNLLPDNRGVMVFPEQTFLPGDQVQVFVQYNFRVTENLIRYRDVIWNKAEG